MTELDLKKIREDAERATQGKYRTDDGCYVENDKRQGVCVMVKGYDRDSYNDAVHIINMSPQNTLALLDRLEKAERKIGEINEELFEDTKELYTLKKQLAERDAQLKLCREELARAEDYKAGQGVYCLRLEEQLKACVEALKFYANSDNWKGQEQEGVVFVPAHFMKHVTAKEALEKVGFKHDNE